MKRNPMLSCVHYVSHAATIALAGVRIICSALLVLMVIFTAYTVVMRYAFQNAPFWGDTLSVFCNIGLTMLGYSLTVRDREELAIPTIDRILPKTCAAGLHMFWNVMTFSFGVLLLYFGGEAALQVPGRFWELNGLPKSYPMLVLPVSGALLLVASVSVILEDLFAAQAKQEILNPSASPGEVV